MVLPLALLCPFSGRLAGAIALDRCLGFEWSYLDIKRLFLQFYLQTSKPQKSRPFGIPFV